MLLQVTHISKSYPGLPVLHDVSFTADEGEIVCLLGPSGCGKTTLLCIVAGLESPDAGRVVFAGEDLAGVPAHRRNFGLMFQDYALFPHRDVTANVAFGLRMQGRPAGEIAGRVREMLALVALAGYETRRVTDLSGGEQQRVALARSLAPGPRLLMLDEPLGALDRALSEQLMNELRIILKRVGVTALYVTHDQEEAFAIADRVLIMRARLEMGEGGHIEQAGTPQAVYRHPATPYVAQFLGFRNLLEGVVIGAEARGSGGAGERGSGGELALPGQLATQARLLVVETPLGRLVAEDAIAAYAAGDRVTVLIRPEAAEVRPAGETGSNVVPGRLLERSFRGSYHLIRSEHAGGAVLTCEVSVSDTDLPPSGAPLTLHLDPDAVTLLPG
ncbi:MAG: iron ABC transporter ATP-binding protein [Chloroflexi bacterium HGW-Chloroflexi-1]|nr:MAG: iron ABC transporter ATP-binding protein [Chloroflexi bacterium HGW-Chloroflexi-1]